MTGTERSSEPDPFADEGGRRGRILMIAGALVGTLMLASAGILVGGASTARRLDGVDWHRTGPGARDGSIPVATESRLRTAPTALGPAPTTLGPSASPAHPSSAVHRRPTPKRALTARPTPRRTNSTRPTLASISRTPTPEPATASAAVQPTRSSAAPPPTAATPPGRTHVPPGQTRHPRKH
ncbi:hypothetical protein ABT120_54130 [Nonomuraea angiospora]|uniref:hypothetical protein n=1 Tax=Nonomuraea angiospora TaxID=46172 RepID=UPI00332BA752